MSRNEQSPDQFVYQEMFEAVLSQRLKPGSKLKESEIAKIFNVSRTVVRQALHRLAQDSIVDIQYNKGASVARPSISKAREILQTRQLIEAELIKLAVANASKDDIKELKDLVNKEEDRFTQDKRSSGIRISGDFHLKLAAISGNDTLTNILTRLVPQTSLIIAQFEKPGIPNCSHNEHLELIEAIEIGDVLTAVNLMQHHLKGIEKKLLLETHDKDVKLEDVFSHLIA